MTFGSSKNMAPKLDNAFLQGFMQVYRMVETGCRVVSCSASGYKYLQQTMSVITIQISGFLIIVICTIPFGSNLIVTMAPSSARER